MNPHNYDWQPEYSVGNEQLDAQHQRLLGLCKRIGSSAIRPTPEGYDFVRFVLKDMARYADEHFRTEETILRELQYPQLEAHLVEHRAYEKQLTDFLSRLQAQPFDATELAWFLGRWWVGHILHSDMEYARWNQRIAACPDQHAPL